LRALAERGLRPLLLDWDGERVLALSLSKGKISFSRAFRAEESGAQPDYLEEISLALLERGEKPEKVVFSGAWEDELVSLASRYFNPPLERLETSSYNGARLPSALYAARLFEKYPSTSLLPREEKRARRLRQKNKLYREAALSFLIFAGVLSLGVLSHLNLQERQIQKTGKKISQIAPRVEDVKKMSRSLAVIAEARASKENTLELLALLAQKLPASIRLRELRREGADFLFKGESPSHALLSETMEVFSGMTQFFEETKLSETRARKRLNEDYFEFEVTGKWKT
jgi:hypothetical protein